MDTNASKRHIRHNLSTLDSYIPGISHDIIKFNIYMKQLVEELDANGKTTSDLLDNLFKAYQTVPDHTFSRYISSKEDMFDDGENMTPDSLMLMCENK